MQPRQQAHRIAVAAMDWSVICRFANRPNWSVRPVVMPDSQRAGE